ncbi:MATE family efflux transporter [Faecalicatena contorta]|uniref:Multidrug export protein MepA n=2 Tax=Faecalicatena TaxID=2005359 RepID=A0ABS2E6J2_9FIRM|nr:MATE family efflux transporter [Faecalicatena contorta]MBM6710811.1 MATE family efflux transporter [Faecalicatena contorta]MBM6737257.1 MATE family efflux transporter [Faecalicatena fissicatena]
MEMSREVNLGEEPIGRLLMTLAVPAITSQLVNALYNMVDRMYIGHIPEIGSTALTGVGVCFPLIMIISAFASLIGMGGAPRASIYMGKKDNKTAEKIMGNCFTALIVIAVILTAAVLLFQEPLLYLFSASSDTIGYAKEYMSIYAVGTIFVQLTLGMNAFISAQGFSKISMLTVVIGAVTNIVLDPVFIFLFDMGVAGAALATILSQALSAVWAVWFLCGKKTVLRLKKENLRIRLSLLMPCVGLGVAPFVMQSTESILLLCFNSSLLKYGGDLAVGAMTILSSVMQFAMLPLQGLTQGGQPIISFNYGAGNMARVKKAFQIQTICCFTFAFVLWAAVQLVPGLFVAIFTNDAQLAELTKWALRIYMGSVLLMGIQISCQQSFIALGNSRVSAFLAIFRKIIVLIPLIYILPALLEDKVFAVFLAEPVADAIAVLTTSTLFYREFKKLMKKEEP